MGSPEEIARQAADGVTRGYTVYYIKAGVDEGREEAMLEALRDGVGAAGKIRIDVNQAWSMPQAVRLLERWHAKFTLDFVEAPVRIDPVENMRDLQSASPLLCVNEGCGAGRAYRVIKSPRRLSLLQRLLGGPPLRHALNWTAHLEGWLVQAQRWRAGLPPPCRPAGTRCAYACLVTSRRRR
jgi:glucarate dehydratase